MATSTWTLDGVSADGRWAAVDGERSIREALWNLLLCRPGERLMRPEFGVGIERYVHEPNNLGTRARMRENIARAIARYEPRIDVDAVEVVRDRDDASRVQIAIRYRIRETGAGGQLDASLDLAAG